MSTNPRTATVTVPGSSPVTLPRGVAFGYFDFLSVWGDPHVAGMTCVDDADGMPVTIGSLTPRELLEGHLKVAELGAKHYGTDESKAAALAEVSRYQAELAALGDA